MAYSTTNPVTLHSQAIAGLKIWAYNTTEGSTVVLGTTGYFTDGYTRGMRLGDLIIAYGSSAGSSQAFSIGIVSSVITTNGSSANSAAGAVLSQLISTA